MKYIHLVPSVVVLFQAGALALGMASWLGGEDDDDGETATDATGGDDDFDMDDDFDDFDEEFGGLDSMDDDGGGDGGGANVSELQNRIDQLETEMANVSSKANTVRSENEQISESVDDVEENVRKLLEIYEMVTRGVNPFVDDVQPGGGGGMVEGGGGNSFGLFDDDGEDPDDDEELDDDIASAEAEDFFDDDALDDFDEPEDELGDLDDGDDLGGMDDFDMDDDEEATADAAESDDEGSGGGTSFEDLKAEYESGDAEWADSDLEEEGIDADDKPDVGFDDDADDPGDLFIDDDIDEAADDETDALDDTETGDDVDLFEDPAAGTDEPPVEAQSESASEPDPEPESGPDVDQSPKPASEPTSTPSATGMIGGSNDTPHLQEPPSGYLADVVVFEWLTGLLDEFGPRNTVRTLNYYERIGWISTEAKDHLFTVLEGLSDSDHVYRQEMGTTELTMDDHLQSLEYIEELADGDLERGIIERCENLHADGIQR